MNLPIHILLLVFIQSVVLTVEISLLLYVHKVPVFSLCSHLHPNKTITPQKIRSPILVPPFTQESDGKTQCLYSPICGSLEPYPGCFSSRYHESSLAVITSI